MPQSILVVLLCFILVSLSVHTVISTTLQSSIATKNSKKENRRHGNKQSVITASDSSKVSEFSTNNSRRLKWLPDGIKNGVASGLAAVVVKTILQPFDTIKTVQQFQSIKIGPIATGMHIINTRGIVGLWSGMLVTAIGSTPSVAVYFGCYSSCKKKLTTLFPTNMKLVAVALSAAIGNTVASVLRVPYEIYKQRIQAGQHLTTLEAIRWSWENEGLFGLFDKGKLSSQIIRDVPYAIVTLVSYELLQTLIAKIVADMKSNRVKDSSMSESVFINKKIRDAFCGSAAGGFGALVTTPMDVIKTRMMTSSKYSSVADASLRIMRDEGLLAFFTGTIPRLMHKIPANGIFFLCYELFRGILDVDATVE